VRHSRKCSCVVEGLKSFIIVIFIYFRFESLVMREWVWAGYPFTKRHLKVGVSPNRKKENSATFLLFLDCVHQVLRVFH
jgi:hypothetical protein